MQKIANICVDKIIQATAGAGKTTGLLDEVYNVFKEHNLQKGVAPKLLLTTFTIKAANELSERLILKARDLGDEGFLSFVTSPSLEVGTMHSLFSKILSQLSDDFRDFGGAYISNSYKRIIARSFLIKSIKDLNQESLIESKYDEDSVLDFFLNAISYSLSPMNVFSEQEIVLHIKSRLGLVTDSIIDGEVLSLVKAVESFSDLTHLQKIVSEKSVESKESKKNLKDLKRLMDLPEMQEVFLRGYVEKHEIYLDLYKNWSASFGDFVVKNSFFTLEDIELLFYQEAQKQTFINKWDYCFFDEYQDTSPIQKQIIDLITNGANRYFVGDPFQSIYFFRGARKEIFDEAFVRISKEDNARAVYRLSNYRSAPPIVEFVNKTIGFIMPDFKPMEPMRLEESGFVEVLHFEDHKLDAEINFIAEVLEEEVAADETVAVLSRGGKDLLACGRLLKKKKLKLNFSISKDFESSLEIVELGAFLNFIYNTRDDKSLLNLLMSEWFFLEDEKIAEAIGEQKKTSGSLWDVLSDKEELVFLKSFVDQKERLRPSDAVERLLVEGDFLSSSESLDETGKREQNILKFLQALSDEELKDSFNVLAFCDDVLNGRYPFESSSVEARGFCTLMTVHGSKGLQFDRVFILAANNTIRSIARPYYFKAETGRFALKLLNEDIQKRQFPLPVQDKLKLITNQEKEESKRLFYVAMTRAKTHLYILGSGALPKAATSDSWLKWIVKSEGRDFKVDSGAPSLDLPVEEQEGLKKVFFQGRLKFDLEQVEANLTESLFHYSNNITKGIHFHEVMERALGLDTKRVLSSYYSQAEQEEIVEAIEYVKSEACAPLLKILEQGHREWGFDSISILESEETVSGKIDLWADLGDEVWIVDYKTGDERYSEKGFEQLKRYQEVVSAYLGEAGKHKVFKLALCFPFLKKTIVR